MKNIAIVLLGLILMSSCKKADTNSCPTPSFSLSTNNYSGAVTVYLQSGNYGFVVVEYGPNGFTRGSGTKVTLQPGGGTISNLGNGTYDIYVQGNCGGSSNSDWSAPQSTLISGGTSVGNCDAPYQLSASVGISYVSLSWWKPTNGISGSATYELRYDTVGFPTGGGILQPTNAESFNVYSLPYPNTTYEFMVRGKCDDGQWGPWSIRKSFYVTNLGSSSGCTGPSYVNATNAGSGVENFTWDAGGANSYEYDWNTSNTTPTNPRSGTSTSISAYTFTGGIRYYFFVRGVCSNNTKTAWKSVTFVY